MTGFHDKNGCGVRVYMGLMGRNMPVSTRWLLRGLLTQGNKALRNSCVSVNPFQPASQRKGFFSPINRLGPPFLTTRFYATQAGEDPNKSVNEQKPVWLDLLLRLLEEQHRSTHQAIGNLKESQALQFAQVNKRIDDLGTTLNKRIDDLGTTLNKRIDDLGTGLNKRIDDVASHVNYLLTLVMLGFAGSGLYLGYQQLLLTEHDQARNRVSSELKNIQSEAENKSGLPTKVAGEQLMGLGSTH